MKIKERPRARREILTHGLRPFIDRQGYWDGNTAVDSDAREIVLCTVLRKQMRLMVAEGHFGKIARLTWVRLLTGRSHARIVQY